MNDIISYLDSIDVVYDLYEHIAVYTVEEAKEHTSHVPGEHSKNLFLRNRKGNQHYLVVLQEDREVDLKSLRSFLECTPLSFASPDRLMKHLKLEPGSVTPFGLINDEDNQVEIILDKGLVDSARVAFHPNRNTATVSLTPDNLLKFLDAQGYKVKVWA